MNLDKLREMAMERIDSGLAGDGVRPRIVVFFDHTMMYFDYAG